MADTFKIATLEDADPDEWATLQSLLSQDGRLVDPDWTYAPSARVLKANSGRRFGRGFPIASWSWNIFPDWRREILRAFCPAPAYSTWVYICTPVNETASGVKTWGNFLVLMNWPAGDEDRQAGNILGLTVEFTHLEALT